METSSPGDELSELWTNVGQRVPIASTSRTRGVGPFRRFVLRGATVIDGTGAPPWGPADIVIEGDRIAAVVSVGYPKLQIDPSHRPEPGEHDIDCHGKFVTPGFVDGHVHIGAPAHSLIGEQPPADYIYKLWLAHGVTTVREMGCFNGLSWVLDQKNASARNEIDAPNLHAYPYFPAVTDRVKTIHTPDQARDWVRKVKQRGADGVKFFGAPPAIMEAALDECTKLDLKSGCHHATLAVNRMNCLTTARWGLTSTEHFYGLPEALFDDRTVQAFPIDYNFKDEYLRFASMPASFSGAAKPGSAKWNEVLNELLKRKHMFVPTIAIYDTNRDMMRARRADWHAQYTWKTMWDYFQPKRTHMGSYFYKWTSFVEVDWKRLIELWMRFLVEFKNGGGRVCVGSDSGFMFQTYGFGYIRELELLAEAGFSQLEVLRAATSHGAELLGIERDTGVVDVGMKADLLLHRTNPLEDLKPLFGTGALRLNDDLAKAEFQRGLEITIKNGVVYDVGELLQDVREMVARSYGQNSPVELDSAARPI
jgi:imidazolonepropionase